MSTEELEANYEPSAEEVSALTDHTPEPMMEMEAAAPTPDDKHAIELDPAGKIKFTANGSEVEATKEEIIKYAQQGYGAANKVGELNRQIEELKSSQSPDNVESYREIDEWAKANPEQWGAIQKQYQEAVAPSPQSQLSPEMQEMLAPLFQEVEGLREFKQSMEAQQQEQKLQQEDSALDLEIKSIRDSYPDLDFDAPGEDGQTLEYNVMKHAADNGITSFKTAFRDFNHEKLIKIAEEKGKETIIQERRARNKLGLLDVQAPDSGEVANPDYNPRTASDTQNYEAALAALKLG